MATNKKHQAQFLKDVIRVGRWWVPSAQVWLEVTEDRIDRWVQTFNTQAQNGHTFLLTEDHTQKRIGRVLGLERRGDTLYMVAETDGLEGESLVERCPDVSLELESPFTDAAGVRYDEALTAVTVCRKPVVTGQQAFTRLKEPFEGAGAAKMFFSRMRVQGDDEVADSLISLANGTPPQTMVL